ncbi:MAG: zinc-binding dehydrogenase, partial [Fidelibacterota bacterium]
MPYPIFQHLRGSFHEITRDACSGVGHESRFRQEPVNEMAKFMEEGFDVGMDMSGNPDAFRDMLRTMHHGGRIAILGIPPDETSVDWNQIIFK